MCLAVSLLVVLNITHKLPDLFPLLRFISLRQSVLIQCAVDLPVVKRLYSSFLLLLFSLADTVANMLLTGECDDPLGRYEGADNMASKIGAPPLQCF